MEDRNEPWGKKRQMRGKYQSCWKVNRIKYSTMRYINNPLTVAKDQPALLIVRNF